MSNWELIAAADDHDRRLDRILRKSCPALPLSAIHRLLRQGRVLVNGKPGCGAVRIAAGERITVDAAAPPDSPGNKALTGAARLPDCRLEIVRETGDLLFLNKPAGLAVHGEKSLDTLVQTYLAPKIPPSLSFKPGPLHRLDQPTSGLIVFSKTLAGARRFSALLHEGLLVKRYLALVEGIIEEPGVWDDALGRDKNRRKTLPALEKAGTKNALTRIRPLRAAEGYSLILAEIHTGRTHQIRAQAALHGHPLAGDRKYGGGFQEGGLLLHAWSLRFPDEAEGDAGISAPPPAAFSSRIQALFNSPLDMV